MGEETLKRKTAKGLLWGGLSNGIQQLLGVVFGIVLARILTAEDYGIVGMLAIFTGIAGAIVNSGFAAALTNKVDASHRDYNAVFWFTLLTGLVLYAALFLAAPLIARFYGREELTNLSRVLFIGFFFSGISVVPYTVMFKRLMVKRQAMIDILSFSLAGIVGVVLAIKGKAYWALAAHNVIYICLSAILKLCLAPWRPSLRINLAPLKDMLPFSSKMFLTNVFQQIQTNFFSVLLGKFYDAVRLGFFSQGYKWMGMGNLLISGMLNAVAQPVMVQAANERNRETRIFRKLLRFTAFVSFPAFAGLALAANEFIFLTIGAKWLPSVIYLQIACALGLMMPFVTLFTQLIIAHSRSNIFMWGTVATGILQALILCALYPLGIIQMLIGFIAVYFASLFFWQHQSKRFIDLPLRNLIKDIAPYAATTAIAVLTAFLPTLATNNPYLLLTAKIILIPATYLALLRLLRSTILLESLRLLKSPLP